MKSLLVIALAGLVASVPASAAIITSEDFEAGAFGWTNNFTDTPGANTGGFTRHLGRGGANATSAKTFTLSGLQTSVNITFDWYRIDSWDGESFRAGVSDGVGSFISATVGFFNDGGPTNIYNPNWTDRKQTISFNFATTATSIRLSFSSGLDQAFTDEAWGVDNLVITDNVVEGAIPEPATWAMMIAGFALVGSAARGRRRIALTA